MQASQRFVDACLGLAWKQWTTLGVRGASRTTRSAVDPEALLFFTAALIDHDARLRDEVADWCHSYPRFISKTRLKSLAAHFGAPVAEKLAVFLRHIETATAWTGKSLLDDLATEGCSLLRLRTLFAFTARAEMLLALLTAPPGNEGGASVTTLSRLGYGKRNTQRTLDDLRLAGVVTSVAERNRSRYFLTNRAELAMVCGRLPAVAPTWHLTLPVLTAFVELAERVDGKPASVQAIEARKTFVEWESELRLAGLPQPGFSATAETYWDGLQDWLIEHVIAEANDEASRTTGMLEGVWSRGRPTVRPRVHSSSAVLPELASDAGSADELRCLDLVQVPTIQPAGGWAWMAMSVGATQVYAHTIGLDAGESWWFTTWELGAPRHYEVSYAAPIEHAQIAAAYGEQASARARRDRPSVQLRLTLRAPAV